MTEFHNAMLGLHAAARASRGLTIVYSRGYEAVELVAVPGNRRTEVQTEDGAIHEDLQIDWIVEAAALEFVAQKGSAIKPQPGDRITLAQEDGYQIFEVGGLDNEPCFRACDVQGKVLRIHTRRVDEES
jgi:hypothetical protein